jgi:Phage integrase family.
MSRNPKLEPKSEELKRIVNMNLGEAKSLQEQLIIKNWSTIIMDLCHGFSAEDVADKYQVGRRTFFRFLERRGITLSEIKEACEREREARELSKKQLLAEKARRLMKIPSNYDEMDNDPWIADFMNELKAQGVTKHTLARYRKTWFDLMTFTQHHLSQITEDDMKNFIRAKLEEAEKNGVDVRSTQFLINFSVSYITPLRILAKYLGLPIKPYLKTVEYEGMYRHVRITLEERYKLLRYLREALRERDYIGIRGLLVTAYETGSRADGLYKGELIEAEKFGMKVYYFKTEEKGKRAKITWLKPVKPKWVPYIAEWIRYRKNMFIRRARDILKEAYEAVLNEGLTKEYALAHQLHVWRHTATNDLLEETGYNLMIVAKRLGWKNPNMIVKVYGDISEEMLLALSGYGELRERAKHEFLYNTYYERAVEEGLL